MFILHSKQTFHGETSEARPATVPPSVNGRSTLCWTGDRNSDSLSAGRVVDSFPDASKCRIDPPKTTLSQASALAPALAVFGGRTCVAWVDFERRINVGMLVTHDGGKSFLVEDAVRLSHSSDASPALAATIGTDPHLFLAWTGRDAEHSINVMVSRNGREFGWDLSRPEGMVNLKTRERSHHSPALAWNRIGLQMAWTATDGRINHMPLTEAKEAFPIRPQTAKKRTFEVSSLGLEARSPYGPSIAPYGLDRAPDRSSHELVLSWTDSASYIRLLLLDLVDGSISEVSRLTETSIDGPQLVDAGMGPHLAWTGTDGPRTINLARIARDLGNPVQPPLGPGGLKSR